ncbi:hypothetical protein [Flavobacterium sp.]|uniref:hypothetical protein n=1 Tax=Flavobacterium sp. TaxID=239 RepID=UPI0025F26704|nr:hypothetical protein [Flavobacterium sp.]
MLPLIVPAATGMQICFGVLRVDFDVGTSKFTSAIISIDANSSSTSFTLTPHPLPTVDGVRIAVLQVRYYQEVNGEMFLLNELKEQEVEVVGVY